MNRTTRISTAERFGRWLGQGWRGYVRGERQVSGWLVSRGISVAVAITLMWAVKLAVLGMLLYVAFWIALLVVFAVVAAWTARNADWDEPEPEWRNDLAGYGLYQGNVRIDVGNPDEDN